MGNKSSQDKPSVSISDTNVDVNTNNDNNNEIDFPELEEVENMSYNNNCNIDDQYQHEVASMPESKYDDDEKLILPKEQTEEAKETTEANLKDLVSLSLKLKNPVVKASSFVDQVIPMLLSLKAEQISGKKKVPIDLVCVLDNSGSMEGEKLELLKNTFNYLVEYLSENDRLAIVEFNSYAKRVTPLTCMTETGKAKTLSAIKEIYSTGFTDICDGMRHAFQILKQRREKNQMTGIFLLSDGLDGGADQKVKQTLKKMNLKDNFSIHSFGYGSDHDPKLMTNIADIADGNFYFVEKLDTVDECFVDCLGGLLSSIAKDITISISPNDKSFLKGLEISKAYGDASMWTKNGQTYTTKLSQLISGRTKDFILEVKIPKYSKDITDEQKNATLVNAIASMTSLNNENIKIDSKLTVTIVNENEEIEKQLNDVEVMKNFYRVKSAEVLEKARQLSDNRDYTGAQKILKDFKEELENCELKNDQFIKNIVKDLNTAHENAQPEVYEEYGKINMMENCRAQYQQKTNLKSANLYQNEVQCKMVSSTKARKC